ncbi:hypothetical protein [Blastococcus litoris]|uniref:hypothetical protein n=1 Tax=Blastococcus litoris TaxID=2171622 RepID=UPI000E3068E7|nr:hypothetical protein [Blastococcus litoris]
MDRDRARQGAVAAAVVGGLVSGATGDYGESDESPSVVLPADAAFGIWIPIYAGSLAYAVRTLRPGRSDGPLLRRTGWPAALGYLLAGAWVRLQHPPRLQLPAIAATTAAAVTAYRRSRADSPDDPGSRGTRWAVREPLGLFAGWITLAAAAATTEVLLAEGRDAAPSRRDSWGVGVLAVATAAAVATTRSVPGSPGYPAAVAWGLGGTAARNLRRRRPVPAAAATLGAVVVVVTAFRGRAALRHPTAGR